MELKINLRHGDIYIIIDSNKIENNKRYNIEIKSYCSKITLLLNIINWNKSDYYPLDKLFYFNNNLYIDDNIPLKHVSTDARIFNTAIKFNMYNLLDCLNCKKDEIIRKLWNIDSIYKKWKLGNRFRNI